MLTMGKRVSGRKRKTKSIKVDWPPETFARLIQDGLIRVLSAELTPLGEQAVRDYVNALEATNGR